MKKIGILLTSVGGLVTPSIIKQLKINKEFNFYIVGVDSSREAIGFYFVDKAYVVPKGNSRGYPSRLLEIAKKEEIDVIIPMSDEEVLSLSKYKEKFEKEGITVTCSDYNSVKIASDKGSMLDFLKMRGIDVPRYYIPNNLTELKKAVLMLGYPKKKIVFKPRCSRGARGFWLISPNNKSELILSSRERQQISLDWLLDGLSSLKQFPKVIVMEYLPGEDYNIDVLAKGGKSYYIIPNQRIIPNAGPVQVGIIRENKSLSKIVRRIVEVFKFDYFVNVEIAYAEDNKRLFVYEINPRVSAPIVANSAAGIDILSAGIKIALGRKIKSHLPVIETRMQRYWNEYFVHYAKKFDS